MVLPSIPISWGIVGALVLTLLLTSCGWNNTYKTLNKERQEHTQVVENFKTAQKLANQKAEAKRVELEKKGAENAKIADQKYTGLLAEYRANLVRFKANQSGGVGPSGGQLRPTQGGNRSSGSPLIPETELIITVKDADICAVNTSRLVAVREWALDPPH